MPNNPLNPFDVFRLTKEPQVRSDAPSVGKGSSEQRPAPTTIAPMDTDGPSDAQRIERLRAAQRLQRIPPGPLVPRPAQLFDNLHSRDVWKNVVTATAHGSLVIGGIQSQTVTLDNAPTPATLKLDQFPKGTHAYLSILVFTYAPSVTTATGELSWTFTPNYGGFAMPLGEYTAAQSVYNKSDLIIDAALVDPGVSSVGTIAVVANTVTGTPTLFWRLLFGYLYFVPEPGHTGYERYEASHSTHEEATYRRQ